MRFHPQAAWLCRFLANDVRAEFELCYMPAGLSAITTGLACRNASSQELIALGSHTEYAAGGAPYPGQSQGKQQQAGANAKL